MSLILEALRKSEAERQRGQSPGLFVEHRAARVRERRTPAWAWVVATLGLATLLAWAWQGASSPPLAAQGEPSPAPQARVAPRAVAAPASPELPPLTLAPSVGPAAVAPAPRVETAPAAIAPAPTAPPTPDLPYVAGMDTLPASERAALPPLKLSMHVYAADPRQRFVILDGQRLVEGASPASGVVLEEIRRDGLILSINGQRLLLARP